MSGTAPEPSSPRRTQAPKRSEANAIATAARFPRNPGRRFGRSPLPRPNKGRSFGAASFRVVPRLQKPAFGVRAHSRLVRTGSEVGVEEGGCSPTRAGADALAGCRGSGRQQAHWRLPQSRQRRAAGVADHNAGPSRRRDGHLWRGAGGEPSAGPRPHYCRRWCTRPPARDCLCPTGVALGRGRSMQFVLRPVKEQQRGRRLPPREQDLEPEASSYSAGSHRKRRAHPAAGSELLLVVRSRSEAHHDRPIDEAAAGGLAACGSIRQAGALSLSVARWRTGTADLWPSPSPTGKRKNRSTLLVIC